MPREAAAPIHARSHRPSLGEWFFGRNAGFLLDRALEALKRLGATTRRVACASASAIALSSASLSAQMEAWAALWLEGDLVHLEDLVLRDAGMDVRMATDGPIGP